MLVVHPPIVLQHDQEPTERIGHQVQAVALLLYLRQLHQGPTVMQLGRPPDKAGKEKEQDSVSHERILALRNPTVFSRIIL